jgi:hypothetical protein
LLKYLNLIYIDPYSQAWFSSLFSFFTLPVVPLQTGVSASLLPIRCIVETDLVIPFILGFLPIYFLYKINKIYWGEDNFLSKFVYFISCQRLDLSLTYILKRKIVLLLLIIQNQYKIACDIPRLLVRQSRKEIQHYMVIREISTHTFLPKKKGCYIDRTLVHVNLAWSLLFKER